jgi:hypothetical protein|tara:strand:- start:240 stop:713 length:474 start_codon:yes stop_codon:yes gene_type:complete
MENKYSRGKIYKIVDNTNGNIYIGSTIQDLNERLRLHKKDKTCISRNIINGGDYKMEIIKNYPCNSKYELEEEEKKYILETECINITIPHRTRKEWNKDNKEEISKKRKEDIKNNPERYKNYDKKKGQKITCECGALVSNRNLARHKKSKKHLKKLF